MACKLSGVKSENREASVDVFHNSPREREMSICDQGGGGEGGQKWSSQWWILKGVNRTGKSQVWELMREREESRIRFRCLNLSNKMNDGVLN